MKTCAMSTGKKFIDVKAMLDQQTGEQTDTKCTKKVKRERETVKGIFMHPPLEPLLLTSALLCGHVWLQVSWQ